MEWYVLFCEVDQSYVLVDKKAIVSAGDMSKTSLKLDDFVTVIYGRKPYRGQIKAMSDERDEMVEKLEVFRDSHKRNKSVKQSTPQPDIQLGKRSRTSTAKQCQDNLPAPKKKSNEGARSSRILELNRKVAEKAMSTQILKMQPKSVKDKDPSYTPSKDDDDSSSCPGSDDDLREFSASNVKRKEERERLLHGTTDKASSTSQTVSPSKEELKRMLQEYKLKLEVAHSYRDDKERASSEEVDDKISNEATGNGKSSDTEMTNNDVEMYDENGDNNESLDNDKKDDETMNISDMSSYDHLNYQLYGAKDDSAELSKGIFCRSKDITNALNGSDMKHVVRRLMPGVFVAEKVLSCTYTGRAPTAAGKGSIKEEELDCLHPKAIAAIIKYAKTVAKSKKLPVLKTKSLSSCISQKLGEMKRKCRKASS